METLPVVSLSQVIGHCELPPGTLQSRKLKLLQNIGSNNDSFPIFISGVNGVSVVIVEVVSISLQSGSQLSCLRDMQGAPGLQLHFPSPLDLHSHVFARLHVQSKK